jgi:uncharacterized membrane protein
MTTERIRTAALVAATLSMGFVASIFVHWSNTIMPGLRSTDDRTFVTAYQQLDDAITNPLFLGFGFLGALLLTALAGALQLPAGRSRSRALPWIGTALVLYLAAVVITFAVNEPLNVEIRDAGDPSQIADLAAVRDSFKESTWVVWNHIRSVLSAAAFGCLAWALVEHGRTLRPAPRENEQGSDSWSSHKVSR